MDKNYKQFVDKLNSYIRKYYLFQLVRGIILFILLAIVYYSLITSLEYFNYFDPKTKIAIVLITLILTTFIAVYFLVFPLIKLAGLGKRLNYYDVSSKLSTTYPEIKDKLINIIELENEPASGYSYDLKKASIEQKIEELKIFSFSDAIKFKDLKVIFGVFLGVFFLFAAAFSFSPDYFKESSVRLVNFQQSFQKPAPFSFHLDNSNLEIISGESIKLIMHCEGKEIPQTLYVNISGNDFLMDGSNGTYSYSIENINSSLSFYFTDKIFVSEIYRITVLSKPFISSFTTAIQPPAYTNQQSETFQNIGDLKVASGTTVKWTFNTVDTDSLTLVLNDSIELKANKQGNTFEVVKTVYNDFEYKISIRNSRIQDENNLVYKIQTVSDLYPEIKVVQVNDSINFSIFHFKGNIMDDYGFHQLEFNINAGGKDSVIYIPFTPFLNNQDFYYTFDFESLKYLGNSFKYYFSVFDNDYINHFKKTISETFSFSFPDYKEIVSKENDDQQSIDLLFKKSMKLTEDIQNDFENFKLKQINSELSEWEKFQTVKDIMSKKTDLENVLNQIKQQNKDASNFLNSFSEEKSEILKKQEQIDQLLKDVFNDELKKLFDEFNELAKQFDSKKFDQLAGELENNLDDLAKQLDKNVQLLKKMKVEQKIERVLDEVKKLAQSEKNLLQNLENRSDLKQLNTEEKENSLHLKNIEQDYNGAIELNKTLEKPMNIFNLDQEFSEIKENYDQIMNESEKGNMRKTLSELDKNAKSLDQLAFSLDQMLKDNKSKQNGEDIEDLRQILDNLILVSFDQEKILDRLKVVDFNNPVINQLKIKQLDLNNQVAFVRDSLYALAKRTPEISTVINKEMLSLEESVNSAFDNLESGNVGASRMYQQYSITAANNLALFLSEALENIKEQEKNSMPGEGDCEKPGGNGTKSGMKGLKESQSSIKDQLQQMIDQMKKGEMGKMSRSIGQTLAQQEMMQQLINDMLNSGGVGSKASDQLKVINQLIEQSRRDLINKNVTSELINRQNLILSKLLDAEKSEIERDTEEKRESRTAIDLKKANPEGYFEYKNKLRNENELIRKDNYKLRSFYDQKYINFLNQLKN